MLLNGRKLAFFVVLIVLLTALVSSYIVTPFIAKHDCHHDDCFICFYILFREHIEKSFAILATIIALIGLIFFFGHIAIGQAYQTLKLNNLVFLKVKLSN